MKSFSCLTFRCDRDIPVDSEQAIRLEERKAGMVMTYKSTYFLISMYSGTKAQATFGKSVSLCCVSSSFRSMKPQEEAYSACLIQKTVYFQV